MNAAFRHFEKLALACAVLAGFSSVSFAADLPGKGITVQPANQGVIEEDFQTDLVGMGLADLGYNVQPVVVQSMETGFLSVAQGDATFYAGFWVPLHNKFWENIGGDAKAQRVGTLVKNSIQGYLIDKKTADAYHIKTIDQLKDPTLAKLFDTEGTGKATLYGCDPGWGCERIIENHLDAYKLRDTVTHKQGAYFALIADAIARIKSGKPTLYYTWTPNWVSGVLVPGKDVTWLTVPFTSLPKEQVGAQTVVPGIGNLGFSVNTQATLTNTDFLNKNPGAKKWLELIQIPIDDINAENSLIHAGEKSPEDIKRHAETWKKAHQAQWDAWIAEAMAAAH